MLKFEGNWPALVTPFNEKGEVNVEVLRRLVDHFIANRVDGFYIGGTTGEGIFMPVQQRRIIAETVLSQVDGRVPVIVHAGCIATDDAVGLATHARDHGAAAISSILPPLYASTASIVAYFQEVAASVSELPFLPYLLNPNIDATALMRELMAIPNLQGTKYTGPNMYEFRQILELGGGEWTMFSGMDEQTVYAAMMGATGNIGSTINFMPGAYRQIREYVLEGNHAEAQALQMRANAVTSALISVGFPGALKEVMRTLGFECGVPRLPNFALTPAQRDTLHAKLAETDFKVLADI